MVTTNYYGRLGNNIFQYVFARILAENNDLALVTEWIKQDFLKSTPAKDGMANTSKPQVMVSDWYEDERTYDGCLEKDWRGANVLMRGFFQYSKAVWPYRDRIRGFFVEKFPCTEPDAIVMHLRLGDFWNKDVDSVIHPSWYQACLQKLKYQPGSRKLYLVVENKDDPLVRYYAKFRPIIVSSNPKDDFRLISSCGTVICSNSTFSWWAAFLGHPERVFTFGPQWLRFSPYLKMYDTPTWEYIPGSLIGKSFSDRVRRGGVPSVGES